MRRRFIAACLLAPLLARAQQPARARDPFTIGVALITVPVADAKRGNPDGPPGIGVLEEGLRALGWVDGENIRIVWRSAEGNFTRLPAIMEELVRMPVDVLVTYGPGVDPAMKATRSIPIVMSTSAGIENVGMVKSLGRPDSNVTGVTFEAPAGLSGKRLEVLKGIAPKVTRVAILAEGAAETAKPGPQTQAAAQALGLSVSMIPLDPDRVEEAFARALAQRADAILVGDGTKIYWRSVQERIHRLALRHRVPVMHSTLSGAASGGLAAYGFDIVANYRRMPYFIDRILRGAKASDLPIEQPGRMELVVNRSAAAAIGLTLSPEVLVQADRVVD